MALLISRRVFSPSVCCSCRAAISASRFMYTPKAFRSTVNSSSSSSLADSVAALIEQSRTGGSATDWAGLVGIASPTIRRPPEPHRLHVYSTKHNTHITLTGPNQGKSDATEQIKDPSPRMLISLSAGNIGFRKAGRGKYDAAYQLAAYVLKAIKDRGLLRQMKQLEVVLRGFGQGREAVTKAILGSEGKDVRNLIVCVKDATRLKFGGTRSPNPRRLG